MTAPAAAATSGPIAPAAPRPAPQAAADPFAFAAVLDALPGASAKADASTAEEQPGPSNETPQEESSRGQTARHSLLNDSAVLAALPFALRAASMMNARPQSADSSPSLASPAMKGLKSENGGASNGAGGKAATVGRLVGERAFHFGAATFTGVITSRTLAVNAPFAPGGASAADLTGRGNLNGESALVAGFSAADAAPPIATAVSPTPIAPRAGASSTHRVSATRAAAHEAMHNGQKPDVSAPPPVARVETSPAVHVATESSSKAADGRSPDPTMLAAPPTTQTDLFGAQLSAPFAAGAAFQLDSSTASAGHTDAAPRASALATASTSSASPVREIDVDLSPGGLEDVSMTMRLAGDKLSVVIRAASSQTLGSIEGARDAIADRMAAIGQPLDSLIVKQAGVNTDGNANGNGSSADGGAAGGEQRSAQGAGERGGSNDALSRRGAGRDRSF
jgi:hypothetical protein